MDTSNLSTGSDQRISTVTPRGFPIFGCSSQAVGFAKMKGMGNDIGQRPGGSQLGELHTHYDLQPIRQLRQQELRIWVGVPD